MKTVLTLITFIALFTQAADKPYIILTMSDDMGYADIERFGNSGIHTDFLDKDGNGFGVHYLYVKRK